MRRVARWALLVGCLAFLVVFFARNREDLGLLPEVNAASIAILILLSLAYLVLQAWRYQLVLEQCGGQPLGFRSWFPLFILGRFLNTVVPQTGNLYRAYELKRAHGLSYTRYVGAFFAFAWLDTCLNLALAAILIAVTDRTHRLLGLPTAALVGALLLVAVAGPVLLHRILRSLPPCGRLSGWLLAKLEEALRVAVGGIGDGSYMLRVVVSGMLAFAVAALILFVCFQALGVELGLPAIVLFYVLLRLSSHLSLTPANLGVQEIGFGLLGEALAHAMGEGILAAALIRLAGLLALVMLALPMGGLRTLREAQRLRPRA